MDEETKKDLKENIKDILKESLTFESKGWQWHSDLIIKFDGEEIDRVKIEIN